MKSWPAQLLPVALLALLAALTFWLRQTVEDNTPPPPKAPTHDVDATAENFTVRRYDETGRIKYRLTAPHLQHFADDDSSQVDSPVLVGYREGQVAATVTSKKADVTSKGETVVLRDNVTIVRPPLGGHPETVARMQELTVLPDEGTARTDSLVEVEQGTSWTTGVGMTYDETTSTLVLLSRVRGQYIRPSTSQ
jgi:lipopolysaccharide export system protein LptC